MIDYLCYLYMDKSDKQLSVKHLKMFW